MKKTAVNLAFTASLGSHHKTCQRFAVVWKIVLEVASCCHSGHTKQSVYRVAAATMATIRALSIAVTTLVLTSCRYVDRQRLYVSVNPVSLPFCVSSFCRARSSCFSPLLALVVARLGLWSKNMCFGISFEILPHRYRAVSCNYTNIYPTNRGCAAWVCMHP